MRAWAESFPDTQATIHVSDKGWTDNEIGVHWLRDTFDLYTKSRTTGSHQLLILDGHGSHVSPEFIEYTEHHNIVPLCLPSHSTHHLQLLDVGLFSPLAKAYKKQVRETTMYSTVNVTKCQFLELLYEARLEAYTAANIAGAWRGAGLIPFNPTSVISKVQPISPSAILLDSHGNKVSIVASTSATATSIDNLVAEIRQCEQSSSALDDLLNQLRDLALTAIHDHDVHSEQSKEIIEQRKKKWMTSRKTCKEARVLTIAEMNADKEAKETQETIERAAKEHSKALYGKVTFAKLVWKEFKMSTDVFT